MTFCFEANPLATCVGFPSASNASDAGGPIMSSMTSFCFNFRSVTMTVKRRGVPKTRTLSEATSSRCSVNNRTTLLDNDSIASTTHEAGISSVPISNNNEAVILFCPITLHKLPPLRHSSLGQPLHQTIVLLVFLNYQAVETLLLCVHTDIVEHTDEQVHESEQ